MKRNTHPKGWVTILDDRDSDLEKKFNKEDESFNLDTATQLEKLIVDDLDIDRELEKIHPSYQGIGSFEQGLSRANLYVTFGRIDPEHFHKVEDFMADRGYHFIGVSGYTDGVSMSFNRDTKHMELVRYCVHGEEYDCQGSTNCHDCFNDWIKSDRKSKVSTS